MPNADVTASDRERFARARARGQQREQDPSAVVEAQYDATRDAIDLRFRGGGSMSIPRQIVPGLGDVPASALESISVSLAEDGAICTDIVHFPPRVLVIQAQGTAWESD